MKVCIVGTGAYGSYIAKCLIDKYPKLEIIMLDVGSAKVKSEKEIGIFSMNSRQNYSGLSLGRYFGLGGTTSKWGGQLLFYSANDFIAPNGFMSDLVELNVRLRKVVLRRFGINDERKEKVHTYGLFQKPGIWLSVFKRNIFRIFKLAKSSQITIIENARVVDLEMHENKVVGVNYIQSGIVKSIKSDYYFLAVGAFESARIALTSKLFRKNIIPFSDHISKRFIKIKGGTRVGSIDFRFFMSGWSLKTSRLIGEIDDNSFYLHPVYNTDFPFFKAIKNVLFKHDLSMKDLRAFIRDLPSFLVFIYSALIKREIHVFKNEWFIYLDMDNPTKSSHVKLSDELDSWGVNGLEVVYEIGDTTKNLLHQIKERTVNLLIDHKVKHTVLDDNLSLDNLEDIYHPYKMFEFDSLRDYYTRWPNMIMVNTGILPRCGGINPTAALFPLIENFISHEFKEKVESSN